MSCMYFMKSAWRDGHKSKPLVHCAAKSSLCSQPSYQLHPQNHYRAIVKIALPMITGGALFFLINNYIHDDIANSRERDFNRFGQHLPPEIFKSELTDSIVRRVTIFAMSLLSPVMAGTSLALRCANRFTQRVWGEDMVSSSSTVVAILAAMGSMASSHFLRDFDFFKCFYEFHQS